MEGVWSSGVALRGEASNHPDVEKVFHNDSHGYVCPEQEGSLMSVIVDQRAEIARLLDPAGGQTVDLPAGASSGGRP